jgi:hypothetical protein
MTIGAAAAPAGWSLRIISRTPWQSVTFTGERVEFELVPPGGKILCETTVADDGCLSALIIDD